MRRKWWLVLLIAFMLVAATFSLALLAERNLERGVLKREIAPNGMEYDLYIPIQASLFQALPLVVVFHGGTMDLDDMERLTGLQTLADQFGLTLLYPLQDERQNADRYWNWFLPENQQRGAGEPARVIELLRSLPKRYRIDSEKTVALGFSAGGAMALMMQILYPDVFSGVAIAAGLPFASASNRLEAGMAMSGLLPTDEELAARAIAALPSGKSQPIRAIVVHGLADARVRSDASFAILRQLSAVNDVLDDGEQNGSFSATPMYDGPWMEEPHRPYRLLGYQNAHAETVLLGFFIDGMAHRYPHPTSTSPFASHEGMDFSLMAVEFLLNGRW